MLNPVRALTPAHRALRPSPAGLLQASRARGIGVPRDYGGVRNIFGPARSFARHLKLQDHLGKLWSCSVGRILVPFYSRLL